jgi:hypothetical protein
MVVLSVLIAATSGAAYGWRERAYEGPLPHGEDIRPVDAVASEQVARPSTRERALLDATEPFLNPTAKGMDLRGGQGVCMELGLFYLDAGRLDKATDLFQRLEKLRTPLEMARLGQLGHAVVLATQHKAKESNALIREVFPPHNPKTKPKEKIGVFPIPGAAKGRPEQLLAPIKAVLAHPRWHYYIARTRYLNKLNGIKDDEMPYLFVAATPEVDAATKKK